MAHHNSYTTANNPERLMNGTAITFSYKGIRTYILQQIYIIWATLTLIKLATSNGFIPAQNTETTSKFDNQWTHL